MSARRATSAQSFVLDHDGLEAWGRAIGAEVTGPLTLALAGSLGAGKSTLARAIARGAGVLGPVPSPTFTLVHHYTTASGEPLTHVDLYRLSGPGEVEALGWDELIAEEGILLIEWPDRAGPLLPRDHWRIELSMDPTDSGRRQVAIDSVGAPAALPKADMASASSPEGGG